MDTEETEIVEMNFFQEMWFKLTIPWKFIAFNSYFIWIILLFGGFGIFTTIYMECTSSCAQYYKIAQSMATFFIAIIAASLVDINLSYTVKNVPSLMINTIALVGVAFTLALITFKIQDNRAFLPASIGYLISLLVWVLANAENEKLRDKTFQKAMRGKDVGHGAKW